MWIKKAIAGMMMLLIILTVFPAIESQDSNEITVEVMIDFGDGTVEWAEVTLTSNRTAIKATEDACAQLDLDVDVGWSGWGAFINSFEGMSSPDWSWWWEFLVWNRTTDIWESAPEGASDTELGDGDIIGWRPDRDFFAPPQPTPTTAMKYPWSMFQYDALNLGKGKDHGPESNSVSWIYNTGTEELTGSPVMAQGKIIINNWGGVFCLNEKGELLWKNTDVQAIYTPAIHGDMVLIGGKDGFLYALNASNGDIIWKTQITAHPGVSGVASPPTVVRDRIFIGSFNFSGGEGFIFCLEPENGAVIWKSTTHSSVYFSSPSVWKDRVYIGTMGRYNSSSLKWSAPYGMFSFDANTGALLWNVSVDGSIGSSPTIVDETLLFTSKDGYLYCLNAASGELNWKKNIGDSISSPAISDGLIYVGSGVMNNQGKFLSLDMDGNVLWDYEPNGAVQSSPAIAGDYVYFATNVRNGTIYCLDKDNGQLVWQYKPWPEQYIISSPAIVNGKLFIASDNGRLYCFAGDSPQITVGSSESNQTVHIGENVIFVHGGQERGLMITNIDSTSVTIHIDTQRQDIIANEGDIEVVDTDGDGKKDMSIIVTDVDVTSQTASLTLKPYTEPSSEGASYVIGLVGLVLVLIVIVLGAVVNLRRRR